MSDDVWGEGDVSETVELKRRQHKKGYVDGLSQGQTQSLQDGFDKAYPDGADLGTRVGRILALLKAQGHEQLYSEGLTQLGISQVLKADFFDDELKLKDDHRLLAEWEQKVGDK